MRRVWGRRQLCATPNDGAAVYLREIWLFKLLHTSGAAPSVRDAKFMVCRVLERNLAFQTSPHLGRGASCVRRRRTGLPRDSSPPWIEAHCRTPPSPKGPNPTRTPRRPECGAFSACLHYRNFECLNYQNFERSQHPARFPGDPSPRPGSSRVQPAVRRKIQLKTR